MDDTKKPDNVRNRGNERLCDKVEANAAENQGDKSDEVRPVNMGDVNLSLQLVRDIHVGTSAVFNGPVILKGLSKTDIVKSERCICDSTKTDQNRSNSERNIDDNKIRGMLLSKRPKNKESSTGNNNKNKYISQNIKINNGRSKNSKENECNLKSCTVNRCLIFAIVTLSIQIIIMIYYVKFLNVKTVAYDSCVINKWRSNETYRNFSLFSNIDEAQRSWYQAAVGSRNRIYFSPRNYSKGTNDCSFDCNVKQKSVVKFVVPKLYFACSSDNNCLDVLSEEFRAHMTEGWSPSQKLNDIYFNYIVTVMNTFSFMTRGKQYSLFVMYEGRPLHCPHDESFLVDNHLSKVTISVPYCFPGNSSENQIFNNRVFSPVDQLFKNLNKMGILVQNPVLEFPIFCNNTLLLQKSSEKYNITFYEKDVYFDQVVNLNIANTLLFSRKLSVSKFSSVKYYSVNDYKDMLGITNPFPYGNLTRSKPFETRSVTIKFIIINNFCPDWDIGCNAPKKYVAENINKSCQDSVNYFMFLDLDMVFEGAPLDCFEIFWNVFELYKYKNKKSIIIKIIRNSDKLRYDGFMQREIHDIDFIYSSSHRSTLKSFIQLLQPIVNHLNSQLSYKKIKYEIRCFDLRYWSGKFLTTLYGLLTDDIITVGCRK